MIRYTDNSDPAERANDDQQNLKPGDSSILTDYTESDYRSLQESMHEGLKPPWALYEAFMQEADLMLTYKICGSEYNKVISFICSDFEKAYADKDIDRMIELYDDLEVMKLKAVSQNPKSRAGLISR